MGKMFQSAGTGCLGLGGADSYILYILYSTSVSLRARSIGVPFVHVRLSLTHHPRSLVLLPLLLLFLDSHDCCRGDRRLNPFLAASIARRPFFHSFSSSPGLRSFTPLPQPPPPPRPRTPLLDPRQDCYEEDVCWRENSAFVTLFEDSVSCWSLTESPRSFKKENTPFPRSLV